MSHPSESKRRGPTQGFQYAGIFGKITYSFVNPLLRLGAQGKINDNTADDFFPEADRAEPLCEQFEAAYSTQLAKAAADSSVISNLEEKPSKQQIPPPDAASILWRTFFQLYRWRLLEHLLWCFIEIGVRVGSPLLLRQFLDWLVLNNTSGTEAAPTSEGWMWAGILAAFSYCYVLVHHQLFWRGMRMGMNARLQAIGAIEAKTLRLNAAAVADVTGGRIVNVVSNDVRRFDEAGTFWVFLIGGPVELIIVLVLVGLRLGFAASVAGVATLLLLIPAQAFLSRYIGRLRAATAAQTDERVRLSGEAISGILACKMLAWEDPLLDHLQAIRTKEAGFIAQMNRIRAFNMALSYAITPVVSVITFATARGTGAELTVANVFYSLALLSLPKLYCAEFFVHGVECVSELRIGVRRMAEFLATPEPPAPWHERREKEKANAGVNGHAQNGEQAIESDDVVIIREADFDWGLVDHKKEIEYKPKLFSSSSTTSLVNVAVVAAAAREERKRKKHVDVVVPGSSSESTVSASSTDDENPSRLPTLPKLSLRVRRAELLAIVGPVGAGKSSILAALLGELQPTNINVSTEPAVEVRGSVAYCQQIPWIMSGTVRDNILFGLPYEEHRFNAAVHAAALHDDLLSMPAGVETEIGERGISISGGQKARLSLARAAYSQAEVQLMDDPLSAVDPRVGRDLFTRCIGPGGVMEKATRVLVTHQKQYLPRCDRILVVRQGKIVEQGTYTELAARGVAEVVIAQENELHSASVDDIVDDNIGLSSRLPNPVKKVQEEVINGQSAEITHVPATEHSTAAITTVTSASASQDRPGLRASRVESTGRMLGTLRTMTFRRSIKSETAASGGLLRRFLSTKFGPGSAGGGGGGAAEDGSAVEGDSDGVEGVPNTDSKSNKGSRSGKLTVKEDRAEGSVTWAVYGALLKRLGAFPVIACALGLLGGQALYLYSEYWLSQWASADPEDQQDIKWVWVYAIFAATVLIISILRAQLFFWASLRASTALHDAALNRLLHAPLSFFHTNPTGRVLNRFSKDQGSVDEQLPMVSFDSLQALMMVVGAFTLLVIVVPFILPVFIPLGIAFFWVQRRYLKTSRELKRFEAITRSPLYAAFSATLKGLPTIRAYRAAARFRADFLELLSSNISWWHAWLTTARWIGFRLDLMVAILLTVAPLLMMSVHDKLSPRLVGLALTQSLYLAGMLQWMVRQAAEVENNMTSAERLLSYCSLEQEPPTVAQGGNKPDSEIWPSTGALQYENVTAIYRRGLPPVLQNISFTLPGGVSCGVVGRTGSGKSSLMLTLFRLIPVTSGRILLDDIDTSSIGLDALRRQIAIIPQDPVLFSGTLRSNLDPWGKFDDATLWDALEMAQLKSVAAALRGGLDARMQEAGDNISAGQRQLLCLARALLQDAAILALDEATANVDRGTDAVIQAAVKKACSGGGGRKRTLLVIAHRIDTIMDCDQLLVLANGKLIEQGPPQELASASTDGTFSKMVAAARAASRQA